MKHQFVFDSEISALVADGKLSTLGLQHEQNEGHILVETEETLSQEDQDFLVEALSPVYQQFHVK